ncbi:phosphoribosylformylglycinamidine synthase subunit PurQ [Pendulispora albinea]|uniref:Phosphoribosylformylglycinamidine synthase subunit PurQ n=2 Tax=Pendulispora albinea TaxID=2741071 RepID=A0ABZ2M587_9BACT
MVRTLRGVCGLSTTVIRHTETELPAGTDLVAIPGGFCYGDYLRAGAIAKVAPIIGAIVRHANRGGYVLGVCNGFQILTEVGLLPGALTRNKSMQFACGDVYVKVGAVGPYTPQVDAVWRLPIAHGEGRYQATPAVLAELEQSGRIALQYCEKDGAITEASNPNGADKNIAALYGGPRKNVFGIMPHPERMSEAILGGIDGRIPFDAVIVAGGAAGGVHATAPAAHTVG